MIQRLYIIILVIGMTQFCQAQDSITTKKRKPAKDNTTEEIEKIFKLKDTTTYMWSRKREIGMDFTPLISNFVPFNLSQKSRGLVGVRSKFYDRKYAFRINFGSNLEATQEDGYIYLGIGYERRRNLYKKWTYTSGWDAVTIVNDNSVDNSNIFVGFSRFYGLEYNITDNIFISTEASLRVGLLALRFDPATSIFVNYRF